jgi:hypothetical protein
LEESIEREVLAAANADKLFQLAWKATDEDVLIDNEYNLDPESCIGDSRKGHSYRTLRSGYWSGRGSYMQRISKSYRSPLAFVGPILAVRGTQNNNPG